MIALLFSKALFKEDYVYSFSYITYRFCLFLKPPKHLQNPLKYILKIVFMFCV